MILKKFPLLLFLLLLAACREDEMVLSSTDQSTGGAPTSSSIKGFFLLNEGNMGSNKATLDYYDYETGIYSKNIYAERNPEVVKELGDVGNDLQIYGEKLYAVINCSNLVEVMDVKTARHLHQLSIPNCRYITFHEGYAYISSYAGPVGLDPNARLGYVAKVDTATFALVDTCVVGYQPEEMQVVGNRLYVANSGGYRAPNYDNTLSVIDLGTFKEIRKIPVAINLHRLEADRFGNLYVSSRGNQKDVPSQTYVIDTKTEQVIQSLDLPNNQMTLCGDSLYCYGNTGKLADPNKGIHFTLYDVLHQQIVKRQFTAEGVHLDLQNPYGIAVHPHSKEILITDAKNYVTPGKLHCLSAEGQLLWTVTTGDIPAHIAFTTHRLQPLKK